MFVAFVTNITYASQVGMQPAGSIKYDDFVFDGKKPFAGMKDGNSEITFMKKKFFQSSLKHIL